MTIDFDVFEIILINNILEKELEDIKKTRKELDDPNSYKINENIIRKILEKIEKYEEKNK